jgi:hypothetical protein
VTPAYQHEREETAVKRSFAASKSRAGLTGALGLAAAILVAAPPATAQTAGAREMPARSVPVPDTVSPQM